MNHPELEHAIVMLNNVEARVRNELSGLSRAQINWRPDPKSWSIAECLDHLIVTNSLYFQVLDDIKNHELKTPLLARIPGWVDFCSNMILKSVDPDTVKKVKTLRVFEPSTSDYPRSVIDDFMRNIQQLKTYFHELDGYGDHSAIRFASPASRLVILDLDRAVQILWKHCVRHLHQAKRLTAMPGFPSGSN